jgi:hypothetical protein
MTIRRSAIIVSGVAVAVSICIGFLVGLSKSDWASWVQAIGSIGAIAGAFYLGERQAKVAERARRELVVAVAEFAFDAAQDTVRFFLYDPDRKRIDSDYLFTRLADGLVALRAVPLHEVGSAEAIKAIIKLRRVIERIEAHKLEFIKASGRFRDAQNDEIREEASRDFAASKGKFESYRQDAQRHFEALKAALVGQ